MSLNFLKFPKSKMSTNKKYILTFKQKSEFSKEYPPIKKTRKTTKQRKCPQWIENVSRYFQNLPSILGRKCCSAPPQREGLLRH